MNGTTRGGTAGLAQNQAPSAAMFWGCIVAPGAKPTPFVPPPDGSRPHISQVRRKCCAVQLRRVAPAPSLRAPCRCGCRLIARSAVHAAALRARAVRERAAADAPAPTAAQATLGPGAKDGARVALRVRTGEEDAESILLCAFRCVPRAPLAGSAPQLPRSGALG